jgi:hypothetical protein
MTKHECKSYQQAGVCILCSPMAAWAAVLKVSAGSVVW